MARTQSYPESTHPVRNMSNYNLNNGSVDQQNLNNAHNSARREKLEGFALCIAAGVCFGANFNPVFWIQQNVDGASPEVLDYVFWHFSGIFLASATYLVIYIAVKKTSRNGHLRHGTCPKQWRYLT